MTTNKLLEAGAADVRRAYGAGIVLLLLSLALAGSTQNTYDTGDSLQHYLSSRYALAHPQLFLDSWAKPLFVLLTVLPAQAGLFGLMLFQCGVAAGSAHLAFRVAQQLRIPLPWLAVPFTYAAPDYFLMQFSGLTEPLFGLVLVAGLALAVRGRAGWSAAVLSGLPFVRAEGFVLLGVWAVYLAVRREWRALPLLAAGFVGYSLVGWAVLGELGWVFGRNAYAGAQASYGHGEWLHFVLSLPGWLGWALLPLFGLGLVAGAVAWAWPAGRRAPAQWPAELLLLYGSLVAYTAAHSAFWALGIFKSFGMTRVLAALTPLAAVVALSGLAVATRWVAKPVARHQLRLGLAALVLLYPLTGLNLALRWSRDFGPQGELVLNQKIAAWLRATYPARLPVLATSMPALHLALGTDPFGPGMHRVNSYNDPALPAGTVVVWDDRTAVFDDEVSIAQLRANAHYTLRWQAGTPRNLTKPHANDSTHIAVFERVR